MKHGISKKTESHILKKYICFSFLFLFWSISTHARINGEEYKISAVLVNPEQKSPKKEATIQVTTSHFRLIDPASVNEKPMKGEGHLHYQIDNGFIIATPVTKLSFHALTPGIHKISVTPVGNDHKPVGNSIELTVMIPSEITGDLK